MTGVSQKQRWADALWNNFKMITKTSNISSCKVLNIIRTFTDKSLCAWHNAENQYQMPVIFEPSNSAALKTGMTW